MRLIDVDALLEKDEWVTYEAVPLNDIYRVIAGHSDYHGYNILAALTCIAEGKAVNPVKPLEAEPVRHALWEECDWVEFDGFECIRYPKKGRVCTNCRNAFKKEFVDDRRVRFCPHCGVEMASGAKSEEMTDLLADFSEGADLEHMTRFAMLQAFKNK